MTRAEACRAIAEKLGYYHCGLKNEDHWFTPEDDPVDELPDFFDSESASARLLDAMPCASLKRFDDGPEWYCSHDLSKRANEAHADRKTAVVLAACKWLQIEPGDLHD